MVYGGGAAAGGAAAAAAAVAQAIKASGAIVSLEPEEMQKILASAQNPQGACERLIDAANYNGGEDNIAVVVVYVI